ncbi:TDP-N-acetylfucosamine:lipid II N-acetylfucosaminyltransferase [Marinobacterium maritimum]
MSKRQPGRNQARTNSRASNNTLSASSARQNLQQGTKVLESLKALASHCINNSNFNEAEPLLERALKMSPEDSDVLILFAKVFINTGRYTEAVQTLKPIFDNDLSIPGAYFLASYALYHLHDFELALEHISKALMLNPYESEYLFHKATTLMSLSRYMDAVPLFERLLAQTPDNFIYLNNAGNLCRDLGQLEKAQEHFQRAMKLTQDNSYPYSNYLTTLHYDPQQSQESIYKVCLEWEQRFAPKLIPPRPIPKDMSADKCLRIGMISDGFRNHPVGQMIIAPLEQLPDHAFQFVCYSSSSQVDHITRRFQKISEYKTASHLSDEALAQLIREDEIDILFDLAGHNSGTRMKVMAMQPAPILVKWVGGLINTTGLSTIDYLLTDFVESPEGDDRFYTEKLIRMPGDYICYEAPPYTPEINTLPAKSNGYITLGCFNNPMKLNPVVLEQWAHIMRQLPDSRLYLKGHQYTSEDLCQHVLDTLAQHDIAPSRITLEGPSKHHELLASYNQIDIALDPWPYSGGLTTCEAFLMGVPVVTMPGPTFAGRHSASHLVNTGMPELVTHSWEEYRERVIELAADLDSLSTIRSHLRSVLLQSPVCDANKFANHLNNALRGIWQRYTENRKPTAMTVDTNGDVLFEDASAPIELHHPKPPIKGEENTFRWEFEGKVIAIDHGSQLFDTPIINQMLEQELLELIAFDPSSHRLKHPLRQQTALHYFPNIVLGSGEPVTLFACQAAERSATLQPSETTDMPPQVQQELSVLAQLPLKSIALDQASELPQVDWLVLDELNDASALLKHGARTLADTLLIHIRIAFKTTHLNQPSFGEINAWANENGYRFYCFSNEIKHSALGGERNKELDAAFSNELISAIALFIPNETRISALTDNQKVKLAFIADSVYKLPGLSYEVLSRIQHELSKDYLQVKKRKAQVAQPLAIKVEQRRARNSQRHLNAFDLKKNSTRKNNIVHICFNNMHIEPLLSILGTNATNKDFNNIFFIEQTRSVPSYTLNTESNDQAYFFDNKKDIENLTSICSADSTAVVFIHGLFYDWQIELLKRVPNNKKVAWVMWGGDFYGAIKSREVRSFINEKIDFVSTGLKQEQELFDQYFDKKPKLSAVYSFGFENITESTSTDDVIFVGNSGDPSNNHMEMLEALASKKDIEQYKIVVPFTYNGTADYIEQLREKVRSLGLNNVEFLTQQLDRESYYRLLSKASLYISAHDRQQGFGHITACLYFGVPVVIKDYINVDGTEIKNPSWHDLVEVDGFDLIKLSEFKQNKKIQQTISGKPSESNKEKAKRKYSNQSIAEGYIQAYKLITEDINSL